MSPRLEPPRWPHRLALLTALCAVPLVLFGGSVTTLGAGMAVEGWLVAEGHFLLLFPVDKWFRDMATFVEHTHRLFGALVGVCAIAMVICALRSTLSRGAKAAAALGLFLICVQGTLGGFRVLESSPELAFLHGALAQGVFAYLCALAVVLSPRWLTAREEQRDPLPSAVRLLAWSVPLVVYGQIVLGAWYRHALRPTAAPEAAGRLALHILGAFVALAFVAAFALALLKVAREAPDAARSARRMGLVVGLQVFLGLTAWVGYRPEAVAPLELAISILHVLGGALLLAECVRASLWILRTRRSTVAAGLHLEGAR